MQYNPRIFKGEEAGPIFSEVLERNRTAERNMLRILDNIKGSKTVSTIDASPEWKAYKEKIRETDYASYADTIKLSDADVVPQKMMVLEFFTMDQLRGSRFDSDMAAGAANITSNEFEQAVLALYLPKLSKAYEKKGWNGMTAASKTAIAASAATTEQKAWAAAQTTSTDTIVDGIITKLISSGSVNALTGSAPSISNLDTCYDEVLTKLNAVAPAVISEKLATIYAPMGHELLIRQANKNKTYRDVFTVSGDSFAYLGVPIEFIPIDNKMLLAGRGGAEGDLIWGTDLLSDFQELKISKVNEVSDEMFIKAVAALDTAALVPQQKVLRIANA